MASRMRYLGAIGSHPAILAHAHSADQVARAMLAAALRACELVASKAAPSGMAHACAVYQAVAMVVAVMRAAPERAVVASPPIFADALPSALVGRLEAYTMPRAVAGAHRGLARHAAVGR